MSVYIKTSWFFGGKFLYPELFQLAKAALRKGLVDGYDVYIGNGTISKRIFRTINNVNKYGKGVMCVI